MSRQLLPEWVSTCCPVVGMLHLPPLPGSPRWSGDWEAVRDFVLKDAASLCNGGVDGIMIENFGDTPFWPGRVPAETIAAMTALVVEVRRVCEALRSSRTPIGVNVLRNDGCGAMAIAATTGASFIRVNVLSGARVTDQGLVQGIAHELLRLRASLKAEAVRIWADVDVKHSVALAPRPLADDVDDLIERAGANAVIVSGRATGTPVDQGVITSVKKVAEDIPVVIGSGADAETVGELISLGADAIIVGTSLKFEGRSTNPVDVTRVLRLMESVQVARVRSSGSHCD